MCHCRVSAGCHHDRSRVDYALTRPDRLPAMVPTRAYLAATSVHLPSAPAGLLGGSSAGGLGSDRATPSICSCWAAGRVFCWRTGIRQSEACIDYTEYTDYAAARAPETRTRSGPASSLQCRGPRSCLQARCGETWRQKTGATATTS